MWLVSSASSFWDHLTAQTTHSLSALSHTRSRMVKAVSTERSVVIQHHQYTGSEPAELWHSVHKSDCCDTHKPFSPTSVLIIKLTFSLYLPGFLVLNSSRGKSELSVACPFHPPLHYTSQTNRWWRGESPGEERRIRKIPC